MAQSAVQFPGQSEIKIPPLLDRDNGVFAIVKKRQPGGIPSMPMEDSLDPDYPLPLFLLGRDEPQGRRSDRALVWSRVSKTSILIAGVMAAGFAVLSAGEPAALLAAVKASLAGDQGLQPADQLDTAAQSSVKIKTPAAAPAETEAADAAPAEIKASATAPTETDARTAASAEANAAAAARGETGASGDAPAEIMAARAAPADNSASGAAPTEIKAAAGVAPGARSAADTQPTTTVPATAAASPGAGEDQAAKSEPASDALLKQSPALAPDAPANAGVAHDDPQPAPGDPAHASPAAPAAVAETGAVPPTGPRKKHHHARAAAPARQGGPTAAGARASSPTQSAVARFQALRQQQNADARASFRAFFGLSN